MGNKPAKVILPVIDGVNAWAHYDKGKWSIEQTKPDFPSWWTEVEPNTEYKLEVKRSKKVDVPTEQWQKDIERKVEVLMQRMDRVEPKCIFNWSKYNQDAEKWDKLFNELNDADE